MAERIGSPRDAVSTLFNLPRYRVIAVGEEPSAGRWVDLEIEQGCPGSAATSTNAPAPRAPRSPSNAVHPTEVRCRRFGVSAAGSATTPPARRRRSPRPPRRSRPTPAPPAGHARPWSRRSPPQGGRPARSPPRSRVVVARADHPDRGCGTDHRRRHDGGAPHRDRRAPLAPSPLLPVTQRGVAPARAVDVHDR